MGAGGGACVRDGGGREDVRRVVVLRGQRVCLGMVMAIWQVQVLVLLLLVVHGVELAPVELARGREDGRRGQLVVRRGRLVRHVD